MEEQANVVNEDSIFEEALKKYEKEKKDKEDRKNKKASSFEYEDIEWEGCKDKGDIVFRILGNPIESRKKSTDPAKIFFSKILTDKKNSYINVIWKQNSEGELDDNWILKRLYDTVMESVWVQYTEKDIDNKTITKNGNRIENEKGYNGKYEKVNKTKQSFIRIDSNLKENPTDNDKKYKKSFYPSKRILMNIISRMDSWCRDNKHSKLLSSKNEKGNDKEDGTPTYFSDYGIPKQVYDLIMENVVSFRKNWNLDIVLKKDSDSTTKYSVRDIREEKISQEIKNIGKDGNLTDEENSYVLYNIDKFSKHSSYSKLRKNLIGLFGQVDIDLNRVGKSNSFKDELDKLADQEEKERDMKNNIENTDINNEIEEEIKEVKNENIELIELCKKNFLSWNKVPDDEKTNILKVLIKFEDTVPIWKNIDNTAPCINTDCYYLNTKTKTVYPLTGVVCPVCGAIDTSSN